jgi:hypothetical protein
MLIQISEQCSLYIQIYEYQPGADTDLNIQVLITDTDVRISARCWKRSDIGAHYKYRCTNISQMLTQISKQHRGAHYRYSCTNISRLPIQIYEHAHYQIQKRCWLQRKDSQVKIQVVYIWLERSCDHPEVNPGQQACPFVLRILSKKEKEKYFPEKKL